MPVELRKRKPREAPAPAPPPKKTGRGAKAKVKEAAEKVEEKKVVEEEPKKEEKVEGEKKEGVLAVGDVVELEGFGGEIETNDGEKTTLKKLVGESKTGVVLFTYPKASTPGCKMPSLPSHLTTYIHQAHQSHPMTTH